MPLYAKIKGPVGYETIGSPTMVDGIATGFSSSNYYKLDTPFKPGHSTWEIVIRAKVTSFATKCNFISYGATDTRSVQVGTTTTGAINVYISSNGTSGNLANGTTSTEKLSLDTYYYILTKFTGTTYEVLVSEDKKNWTSFLTVNSSTPIWQGTYFTLGYNYPAYPEFLNGYLDFNESYIKIGDTIFWGKDFARVKIRTLPQFIYEKVGNPNIVNNIIIRDSNSPNDTDYVKLSLGGLTINNTIEFGTKFLFTSVPSQSFVLYNNSYFGNVSVLTSKKLQGRVFPQYTYASGVTVYGNTVLTPNTFYWVKYIMSPTKASLYLSTDGRNYTLDGEQEVTMTLPKTIGSSIFYALGDYVNSTHSYSLLGQINLTYTYVKIDDEYIFPSYGKDAKTCTLHALEGDYGFDTDGKLIWASPKLYLENDASNWIDTELTGNYTFDITAKGVTKTGSSQIMIGTSPNNANSWWGTYSNNGYWSHNNDSKSIDWLEKGNFIVYFTATKAYYVYNGTTYDPLATATPVRNVTYALFRSKSTASYYAKARLYNCKIYDTNNNLIYYLVPVKQGLVIGNYTVPSNGLFDIVTQTFFANQGSGTFIFGKDS